jgi:hypothetical protein
VKNKAIDNNSTTFYEKYYAHLGLTNEECEQEAYRL